MQYLPNKHTQHGAERLDIALDAAGLGIWDLELATDRCDLRSLRHDQLFGYTQLQPTWGKAIAARHVVEEDRQGFLEAFEQAVATGQLHYEVRVRWSDGSVHWLAADGRVFYDQFGVAERVTGVVRETTAEKQALQDAEQANALLDAIFQEAPIGLAAWDEDLRFLRVNSRLAEINGLEPDEHIGKRPGDLLPEIADLEGIYTKWRRILATGEPLLNVEITGATPAHPGLMRSWNENFFPIRSGDKIIGIGAVVEETTEQRRHQQHVELLMQEVNHRAKNLLAVVQAVAGQSARTEPEQAFVGRFSKRIASLAASHDLLVKSGWNGVALGDLVQSQLAHFTELFGSRLKFEGPDLRLNAAAAQTLGMAIHELGTNAAKYGALFTQTGSVALKWRVCDRAGKPELFIDWRETGGTRPEPGGRQGFGHKVITEIVRFALDAKVTLTFEETGLSWHCAAPCALVLAAERNGADVEADR